jgi:hypothetical protein
MNRIGGAGPIDHAEFDRLIALHMPSVASEIDEDERALLHLEMAAVARATAHAIECGDESSMRHHFQFIDEIFARAAPEVANAIYVSYLENVFLGDRRPAFARAREELSPRLFDALRELEDHWERIRASAGQTPPR